MENSAFAPQNLTPLDQPTTPLDQVNINLDPVPLATIPDSVIATTRAYKAHMGLSDLVKQDYQQIYEQFAAGQEGSFRDGAAIAMNAERTNQKLKVLKNLSELGPVSLTDFNKILAPPADKWTPDTVVERAYARAYTDRLKDAGDRLEAPILDDAKAEIPEELDKYFQRGSDLLAKREWWLHKAEDIEQQVKSQNMLPWLADQAKQLIPFYNEAMNRGNAPGVSRATGILLGENEEAQAQAYFRMPIEDMKNAGERLLSKYANNNPSAAAAFARSMAGMSTTEKVMQNILTPLEFIGGVDALKLARFGFRKADVGYRAAQAVKDQVKSANVPEVTNATIAAGSGDLAEAAVQQGVARETAAARGVDVATQTSGEVLTNHLRTQTDAIRADLTLSRENNNRLVEAQEGYGRKLLNLIYNTAKVERVPWVTATEEGFRVLRERAREYFPGRANTLLNVDVVKDPVSGSLNYELKIGNYDATLFTTIEQAMAHARMNGYGEAKFIEALGTLPSARSVEIQDKIAKIEKDLADYQTLYDKNVAIVKEKKPTPVYGEGAEPIPTQWHAEGTGLTRKDVAEAGKTARSIREVGLRPKEQELAKLRLELEREGTWRGEAGEKPHAWNAEGMAPSIRQQGLGYHIVITKPVNETENFIRDGLIHSKDYESTSSTTGWRAQANSLLGWIRGANDTLALKETEQRLKVVYTQSKFLQLAKDEMKYVEDVVRGRITVDPITGKPLTRLNGKIRQYIGKLSGGNSEVFEQFNRALEAARKLPDPETKLPGYFFQTPSELHNFYQSTFKRTPSFEETQAYFAFTRAYEYDLALRNIRSFSNKSRLGAEQWTFYTTKAGERTASATFEAIHRKSLPRTEDSILVHQAGGGEKVMNAASLNKTLRDELDRDIRSGRRKLVEIYDPEARLLKYPDLEGNTARIRYVVSDTLESKPLSYDQIGRRGGGHFEYDYDHYIKQAKIRSEISGGKLRHWYEGDQTLMPIDNRIMGKDIAEKFDTIRELIKKQDFKSARAFVEANMDVPWKEVRSWFRKNRDPKTGEMIEARFSLDQKFHVVPKNYSVNELGRGLADQFRDPNTGETSLVDGTRHGSLARNFQVRYTGARDSYDLFSFRNEGSRYNPVYKYEPARMLDPIPTITRALDRIVNSTYMDDYKIYAVEHWLQENKGILKKDIEELRSAPFHYFNSITDKSFSNAATRDQVQNSKINWYKAKQLIGTPDVFQTNMQQVKQFLHDLAYEKYGPRGDSLVPDWLLDRITSPVDFARSMAFHSKLGLFNPGQLITQSMTYINIHSMAPGHAIQGSSGALLHQWSRMNQNPEILAGLGKAAESLGWKPGHWEEAMKALDKTGFANIGGEYALDNAMKNYYIRNGARQFLDTGQMFFRGAERNFRFGAWYTAFHEFKELNPLAKIGDKELGQILRRADDLTGNMSRASNSILSKGILSVPTQFLTYQIRLAELFWSKRLGETLAQRTGTRALMFGVYSAMFGVPGALGLSGLPLGDYWRKAALENGYNISESAAETFMYEGLPSLIGATITGSGDFQGGNYYNWNDKLGANGFSPFREAMRSNASLWKIIGGAAGSVVGNTLASMDGFTKAMYSMIAGKDGEEAFPMKLDDWLNPLNEITSLSSARRMLYAMNFGKWMTKNESYVRDTSKINAVFMALTGLSYQDLDDQYTKSWTKDVEKQAQKDAVKAFTREFQHGIVAGDNKDYQQSQDYFRRAFGELTRAGYPKEKWHEVIALASNGYESMINRSDYTYYLKDVPEYRKDAALKAWSTRTQLNEKKEQ